MRPVRLATVLVLAALVAPAQAFAHSGLTSRNNLPIPEVMFAWAAAAVLVVSFAALAVLWPNSRMEETPWRPLPWGVGRALGSRPVEILCGAIGVALLVVTIYAGYAGVQSGANNFAPAFILIICWVGLVIASLLLMRLVPAPQPAGVAIGSELRSGYRYVIESVPIRSVLLLLAIVSTMSVPYSVLMPAFVSEVLHGGPGALGWLMTATGVGALAGTVYLAARPSVVGLGRVMAQATLLLGGGLIAFSLSRSIWL